MTRRCWRAQQAASSEQQTARLRRAEVTTGGLARGAPPERGRLIHFWRKRLTIMTLNLDAGADNNEARERIICANSGGRLITLASESGPPSRPAR